MSRGFAEVAASGLFDRDWYLTTYPDVADAGMDPLAHFMLQGWREERDPGPRFSTRQYAADHPDVVSADVNPVVHYLRWGWREGRGPQFSGGGGAPHASHPQAGVATATDDTRAPITHLLAAESER